MPKIAFFEALNYNLNMKYLYPSDNTEVIEEAKRSLPDDDDLASLAEFYKVMGDPTRLRLLMLLQQQPFCVTDLCNAINLSRSTVSHSLKELRAAKLVKPQRLGQSVLYSLDDNHISSILQVALEHIQED